MTNFTAIPMSEVAVLPGRRRESRVRAIVSELSSPNRGSISNSDRLSRYFYEHGLDDALIVAVLKEMLVATTVVEKWVSPIESKTGAKRWEKVEFENPDWRARQFALEYLRDVHGYRHVVDTKPLKVSIAALTLAEDVMRMRPSEVLAELPGALKMLEGLDLGSMGEENGETEDVPSPD